MDTGPCGKEWFTTTHASTRSHLADTVRVVRGYQCSPWRLPCLLRVIRSFMTPFRGVAVGAGYFSQFHYDAWGRVLARHSWRCATHRANGPSRRRADLESVASTQTSRRC